MVTGAFVDFGFRTVCNAVVTTVQWLNLKITGSLRRPLEGPLRDGLRDASAAPAVGVLAVEKLLKHGIF